MMGELVITSGERAVLTSEQVFILLRERVITTSEQIIRLEEDVVLTCKQISVLTDHKEFRSRAEKNGRCTALGVWDRSSYRRGTVMLRFAKF